MLGVPLDRELAPDEVDRAADGDVRQEVVALAADLFGRSRAWMLAAVAAPLALVALFATLSRSGLIALAVALIAAIVLFLIGRFAGVALMRRIAPARLMAAYAVIAIVLACGAAFLSGMAGLVALTAGAYFGEVVRRRLGGRWETGGDDIEWRVVLPTGLNFAPAGFVAAGRDLAVEVEPDLVEVRYGDWTGRPLKELAKQPLWTVVQQHPSAAVFPGAEGEGLATTQARAVAAVRAWDAQVTEAAGPEAVWLACSHGDVIKALLADARGLRCAECRIELFLHQLLDRVADPQAHRLLDAVAAVASREYTPKLFEAGNTDFQFTRGLLGVSM